MTGWNEGTVAFPSSALFLTSFFFSVVPDMWLEVKNRGGGRGGGGGDSLESSVNDEVSGE